MHFSSLLSWALLLQRLLSILREVILSSQGRGGGEGGNLNGAFLSLESSRQIREVWGQWRFGREQFSCPLRGQAWEVSRGHWDWPLWRVAALKNPAVLHFHPLNLSAGWFRIRKANPLISSGQVLTGTDVEGARGREQAPGLWGALCRIVRVTVTPRIFPLRPF
jgi:hypothetical protein